MHREYSYVKRENVSLTATGHGPIRSGSQSPAPDQVHLKHGTKFSKLDPCRTGGGVCGPFTFHVVPCIQVTRSSAGSGLLLVVIHRSVWTVLPDHKHLDSAKDYQNFVVLFFRHPIKKIAHKDRLASRCQQLTAYYHSLMNCQLPLFTATTSVMLSIDQHRVVTLKTARSMFPIEDIQCVTFSTAYVLMISSSMISLYNY